MINAVIYARYSSDRQTEQSIEGQVHVCKDYALRHDINIVDQYIDRAISGRTDKRPEFQRMIKESSRKEWTMVLVYKLDRFSRDKYETALYKKKLKDNGVKLLSAMENIPDTPEGVILESLLEGMAQYYSMELSQKVLRGQRENRLKNLTTGGITPLGYKVENKQYVIDPEDAEIVKYIFKQYSLGVPQNEIVDYLNSNGNKINNKPFTKQKISNILQNEKYIGIYKFNGELYPDRYPQIIDKSLWDRVQTLTKRYNKSSTKYYLNHIAYCGYCNNKLIAESGTSKHKTRMRYYKCSKKKANKNGCELDQYKKDSLEKIVFDAIKLVIGKKENIDRLANYILDIINNEYNKNQKGQILEKKLSEVNASIDKYMKVIEDGLYTEKIKEKLQELENQRLIIESEITIARREMKVDIDISHVKKYLSNAINKELKIAIALLIQKVVVFNDKIDIYFYLNDKNLAYEMNCYKIVDYTTTIKDTNDCYGPRDKVITVTLYGSI